MRKTKLLTGVSAFALAAALSSGVWAGEGVDISDIKSEAIINAAGVDGDVATGSVDDNDIKNNRRSNIGQAVAGVWLGQVVVNGINMFKSEFSASVDFASSMDFGNHTFRHQIANVNNFNTAVNAVQQGAVTVTVGIGSNGI